jgi:hypothetical protein
MGREDFLAPESGVNFDGIILIKMERGVLKENRI